MFFPFFSEASPVRGRFQVLQDPAAAYIKIVVQTRSFSAQIRQTGERMLRLLIIFVLLASMTQAARKQGSPLGQLPKNMEMITHFGERADFSPDNQRIAFMAKSFGDAFVIDLKTRIIRCLTCSVPGAAFLRIMHLSDGNYILIGAERFSDLRTSRRRDNELVVPEQGTGIEACETRTENERRRRDFEKTSADGMVRNRCAISQSAQGLLAAGSRRYRILRWIRKARKQENNL